MKVSVENLGVLKKAEFEVGGFTLICGDNNTGKTYATYALYGFLSGWRRWLSVEIPRPTIDALLKKGITRIDVRPFVEQANAILKAGCDYYKKYLSNVLGAKADRFKETSFRISVDDHALRTIVKGAYERKKRGSEGNTIFSLSKEAGDSSLIMSLNDPQGWPPGLVQEEISDSMIELLFAAVLPRPFMVSAERTGGIVFDDELDYQPYDIALHAPYHPAPVQDNVNFIRQARRAVKSDSFLAIDHRDILDEFADIIGGCFGVDGNGIIYFEPAGRRVRLTMDESSGTVRSLLLLGLYLHHVARPGDLLMVDEPELSLHPNNQRRIARLFARLVNLGLRVFLTTHSDYLVKEWNTLIMLTHGRPYLEKLAKEERYRADELLVPDQIRVYMAKQAAVEDGGPDYLLDSASIDPELGIEAQTFDDTINEMNRIQDAIVWGHDG